MGKVRTLLVKRVSRNLLEKYPEKFSRDFEKNKQSLLELNLSSRLRNRIAGYITSMLTKKEYTPDGEEKPVLEEDMVQAE